jgi:hypothetical protein
MCLLDYFCCDAWRRHVLLDKGIRVTAVRVTAIGVTAVGVIAVGVKLEDFEDILCAC